MLSFREPAVEDIEAAEPAFPGVPCTAVSDLIPTGYRLYVLEDYPETKGALDDKHRYGDDLLSDLDDVSAFLGSLGFFGTAGGARYRKVKIERIRDQREKQTFEWFVARCWAAVLVPDTYDPSEVTRVIGNLADVDLRPNGRRNPASFVRYSSDGIAWYHVDGRRVPKEFVDRFRSALTPEFLSDHDRDDLAENTDEEDLQIEFFDDDPKPDVPPFKFPSVLTYDMGFLSGDAAQEKIAGRKTTREVARDLAPDFEELKQLSRRWEISGKNKKIFEKMQPKKAEDVRPTDYLVQGLIPRGMVTMVVGEEASGKSSLTQHLAMQVALAIEGRDRTFLGRDINVNDKEGIDTGQPHSVAFFSAEEHSATFDQRRLFDDPDGETPILFIGSDEGSMPIQDVIEWLDGMRPVLIIIDPLRSYLTGNEDKSEVISEFLDALVKYASWSGAAVVVVHHVGKVGKGAALNSVNAVWRASRGSSVLTNRVRCGLSLVKRPGGHRTLGIAKTNLVDGELDGTCIDFDLIDGQFVLRSSAPTHRAASGGGGDRKETPRPNVRIDIVQAVGELDRAGEKVTRTGERSLFSRRHPSVATMSRNQADQVVATLVQSGALEVRQDGSLCAVSRPGGPTGSNDLGGE